jgi:DNA repair protein RecO (recombination protein O)
MLIPAYILHQYDWRETSRMLEVFTREHGRLGLVARGSRRASSPWRAVLRPFQPLLLSWMGSGELATLIGAESDGAPNSLVGRALISGFYMNELLLRLLPRQDPQPDLFVHYEGSLNNLTQATEPTLRIFEMNMLSALGYGLNLKRDAATGQPLEADARYRYETEKGLVRINDNAETGLGIKGSALLAIADGDYQELEHLSEARYLLRNVINDLLGEKPLKTRAIMRAFMRIHA